MLSPVTHSSTVSLAAAHRSVYSRAKLTGTADHCPWLGNNCVGFHNQGHFIRFLLWVDIATSYHLLMLVFRSLSIARSYSVR